MSNLALTLLTNLILTIYYVICSLLKSCIPKALVARDINNETVLITGGGNGIGRCLVLKVAARGAKVVVADICEKSLNETKYMVEANGGQCWTYLCNLTDKEAVYSTFKRVEEEVGKITVLVNNAGFASKKRFLEKNDDEIRKTFEINVLAHFWTCKAVLPSMMKDNKGHIVSIASLAGHMGTVGMTDYCSSKFAAVGFLESLRMELLENGYDNIHLTEISPFFVDTRMFNDVNPKLISRMTPEYVAGRILDAILTREEVVYIPSFLGRIPLCLKALLLDGKALFHTQKSLGILDAMEAVLTPKRE